MVSPGIYIIAFSTINNAEKIVFEIVQKKAVKEEIEQNTEAGNEPLHLTVSGNGSWKKTRIFVIIWHRYVNRKIQQESFRRSYKIFVLSELR